MQNENYLGVECPKCGRMFKAEKLQVVFSCNSNYIGKCPRCGCEVEAHLTKRALDAASLSAPDDTTGAFDESIIGSLP